MDHFIVIEQNDFFNWNRWGVGVESNWVHSAQRPPMGLLCQSVVIMIKEKLVELLTGETEVLGENPAPVPICPPQTPSALSECEPGPPRWKLSD
jgi:hypothetical protein